MFRQALSTEDDIVGVASAPPAPPAHGRPAERARSEVRPPSRPRGAHPAAVYRRRRAVALLVVLVVAGGITVWNLETSPSGSPTRHSSSTKPRTGSTQPRRLSVAISWPSAGVSAVDINGTGAMAGPGGRRPVPIASVAKLMTAYVVLQDHPLTSGGAGPAIVVQPSEAAAYASEAGNGDSLVPVVAGERITERQALEALLLPSADNMAWILARWDAGSRAAFLERMNATARRLGMTGTRYTDPSGLSPSTTSTAVDEVRLGVAAMRQPALKAIVARTTAVIPVAGVVRNYDSLLGKDGIVGLKTGTTAAAGGCVLLAAWHDLGRQPVLIVAASFGQRGTTRTMLAEALSAGDRLVLRVERALDRHKRGGHLAA